MVVVARNDLTEIVELPNGCACCDVQGELVDILSMIVRPGPACKQLAVWAAAEAAVRLAGREAPREAV